MQQDLLSHLDQPESASPRRSDELFSLEYPHAELVFGLVYAVGTDYLPVQNFLEDHIRLAGYRINPMRVSDWFGESAGRCGLAELAFPESPEYDRIDSRIKAGNRIREVLKRPDFFALLAASKIYSTRFPSNESDPVAHKRTAHVLLSLKRPEEVETLRKIYGPGFYLIGVFAGEAERFAFLTKRKGLDPDDARALIQRDQKEAEEFGQRTRDTFQMADVFVGTRNDQYETGLRRFMQLVMGDPFTTPTKDEHAMFLAYAASLRSGDLARQVGAAISCSHGDVISLGCNDVPAPGGGLYWADDGDGDHRDYRRKRDANDARKEQIIDDIIRAFRDKFLPDRIEEEVIAEARPILKKTLVSDITEFGRSVHAEMEALTAAGRSGVSSRGATLYTTTFPCHTCTRHIIDAGIRRLVYIEPYPKSMATELHDDAIKLENEVPRKGTDPPDQRIPFEPFLGIGPRRFFDLFSLKLSSGYAIERKAEGRMVEWDLQRDARSRVPMPPTSYIEREQLISKNLNTILRDSNGTQTEHSPAAQSEAGSGVLALGGENGPPSRKLARMENRVRDDVQVNKGLPDQSTG